MRGTIIRRACGFRRVNALHSSGIVSNQNTVSRCWLLTRYGFPLKEGRGPDELGKYLNEGGYSVYQIRASVGMCGYVIAKRLVIEGAE